MHPQCPDAMPFASGLSLFWDDWRGAGDACPAFFISASAEPNAICRRDPGGHRHSRASIGRRTVSGPPPSSDVWSGCRSSRPAKGRLRDVQCARLDVHELAREGKLKLGSHGLLFGTIRFEVAGGPDAQRLILEFPVRSARGEPLDPVRQIITCYWRKAHYGGRPSPQFLDVCNHHY
jgi:hypothetical protein